MHTVCLSMIVKNEAPVIERALRSALPWITHWAVVDTGSTDGTQDIVRRVLRERPGRLVDAPWRGFSGSRNEALALARELADYALFLDADDEIASSPEVSAWPPLGCGAYDWWAFDGSLRHSRVAMVRRDEPCAWVGAVHERLYWSAAWPRSQRLTAPFLRYLRGGERSRNEALSVESDMAGLGESLQMHPADTRARFYLGLTQQRAGRYADALATLETVASESGGAQEMGWFAQVQCVRIRAELGATETALAALWAQCIAARPTRPEPYVELARLLRVLGRLTDAIDVAHHATQLPISDDQLFLDLAAHGWMPWDELALAAAQLGRTPDALRAIDQALRCNFLPTDERARLLQNRAKLLKQG